MTDVRPSPAAPSRAPAVRPALATGAVMAATAALALVTSALRTDEGKSNRAYLDIARIPTVCYGHTGSDVGRIGSTRTDDQCDALLTSDARATMRAVTACTPGIAERPQQLAAATRLAFNIGPDAYCHSGTRSAFVRGDWRHGCDLMLAWDKAHVGGALVRVPGLAARRQRERAMCLVGVAA
jgi:lysozyme